MNGDTTLARRVAATLVRAAAAWLEPTRRGQWGRAMRAEQLQVDRRGRVKTSGNKGYRSKPAQRRPHTEVATATGFAIFLATGSGAALAQDQTGAGTADEIQEVVVTGIRKSIQDSIGVKKNESSIVEVVSAEDIGKLPDASIAEAIGRLPGIAAQRTNGRAQTPARGR